MGRLKPIKVRRTPSHRNGKAGTRSLGNLLNLGPKSSAWLAAAGIHTREQLERLGPIEACRRIRQSGHPVSVLMAYALEGALIGTHWNAIPFETKQWLRAEFAAMKRETKA
ncbi:MAG: TfoX/Sxy family protein [Opitutae bacterium]|nr:TfoX/Sxy family protein [Opitutae bacterium]